MSTAPQTTTPTNSPDVNTQVNAKMQDLLRRSATDPEFRKKLISSPREALRDFHGHEVPAGVDIRFIENTADATFVLPDAIDPTAELSEQEMETVAGGIWPLAIILGVAASAVALTAEIKDIGDDSKWFS